MDKFSTVVYIVSALLVAITSSCVSAVGARALNGKRKGGGKKKGSGKTFSFKDILGVYGFNAQGVIVPPDGSPTVNAVSAGLLSFFDYAADEPGFYECEFVVALNGENGPGLQEGISETCVYQVKESGMGTAFITGIPPVPIPLSFVIVDSGFELRFIRTDTIGIAAGVAKRQH